MHARSLRLEPSATHPITNYSPFNSVLWGVSVHRLRRGPAHFYYGLTGIQPTLEVSVSVNAKKRSAVTGRMLSCADGLVLRRFNAADSPVSSQGSGAAKGESSGDTAGQAREASSKQGEERGRPPSSAFRHHGPVSNGALGAGWH